MKHFFSVYNPLEQKETVVYEVKPKENAVEVIR